MRFLPLIILFFGLHAQANELKGVVRNNAGVKNFNEKKTVEAFEKFTGALADLPFSGAVHYNIGNSFLVRREFEKALSEYQQAITHANGASRADRETRFRALFNSAVILTEMKKVDEALELYQKALEIKPDSLETKTNIELLTQSQGGGEGEGEQDQKNKDQNQGEGQDKKDDKNQKQPEKFENPRQKPKPFNSQDLSEQDVKRIMEELKRQEESIRARMENDKPRSRPPAKDW